MTGESAIPAVVDVLLVDDDLHDIRLICETLGQGGSAMVHVVATWQEALAYLYHRGRHIGSGRPDLILVDGSQSEKHGFDVLDIVKTDQALQSIPVVVFTDHDVDLMPAYASGVCSVILKPLTRSKVEDLLGQVSRN